MMNLKRKRIIKVILPTFLLLLVGLRVFSGDITSTYDFSQAVYDKNGRLLRLTLTGDEKYRRFLHLEEVSPLFIEAILLKEDRWFYFHPGTNPLALGKAFVSSYILRNNRRGASTITMQLARMHYGIDSRSIPGKFLQILGALFLEAAHSKRDILEAYVNLLPFGGNIEGVGAAARIYFNRKGKDLGLLESLTLCVIPQSPNRRALRGAEGKDLRQARERLLTLWRKKHPGDKSRVGGAVFTGRRSLPFLAPHYVNRVLRKTRAHTVVTTLDYDLQALAERHIQNYVRAKKNMGIQNTALMLLDFRKMEIRAMVGSANFFAPEIKGQVNGTMAHRSPGSTLKPFVYGLGIEQGLIHPFSLLKDTPTRYAQFAPENFDRKFLGPLSVADALALSRNIPALHVAALLKEPDLYSFLKKAGITRLRERDFYGITLALGGFEISMVELVRLYAMLANEGLLRPVRDHFSEPGENDFKRLLSPQAAFLTLQMMKDAPRPGLYRTFRWKKNPFTVYWKTGTSTGFRDAWALGIFGPYVLAVWVGNFDGSGNPAFVGLHGAAPLMFEFISSVAARDSQVQEFYREPPSGVKQVQVCTVSGGIPGPFCHKTRATWFIPGKSPFTPCSIHRKVYLDARNFRVCPSSKKYYRSDVYEFWSSDLLSLFREAGIPRRVPPPYTPTCPIYAYAGNGKAPRILSPSRDVIYKVQHQGTADEIGFSAAVDAQIREVYWFLNDAFIGKSRGSDIFYWRPRPGNFRLRVVDNEGRSDSSTLRVEVLPGRNE